MADPGLADGAVTPPGSRQEQGAPPCGETRAKNPPELGVLLEDGHPPTESPPPVNCCARLYGRVEACFAPCLARNHPSPATRPARVRHALLCPPHGHVARLLAALLALVLVWALLWSLTLSQALPGGSFFALLVLLVTCIIGGRLISIIKLPPLLGMLIVGFILRNVPYINVGRDIDPVWAGALRNMALVVILTRAGLGLDPAVLKRLSCVVIRLAFTPCLVEAAVAALASYLILGFPWQYGLMLGFVLAAVSPAVVVPSMLDLEQRRYGTDKGIPTLVIAAASVDDVLAISGFGIILGITFAQSSLAITIVRGPLEALLGVVYGVVGGLLVWYIPHRKHSQLLVYRFLFLYGGGMFAVFGSNAASLPGAGALGCLTLSFTAALGWRRRDGWQDENPMSRVGATLWVIFQPLLFGLIGNEIAVANLDPGTIGGGVAVLAVGMVFRMAASFLVVFRTDLNWKERAFIPFAWLPKATVQAAIGSIALTTAREAGYGPGSPQVIYGFQILTIAVLVILITAPLGSALIAILGPRLLHKQPRDEAKHVTDHVARPGTHMQESVT